MSGFFAHVVDTLTSPQVIIALVWTGMAALTVAVVVLMRTRWGQQQPLRKCVVLSLFAHLLFAAYATTVHVVRTHPHRGNGSAIRITEILGNDTVDAPGVVDGVDGGSETAHWVVPAPAADDEPAPQQAETPEPRPAEVATAEPTLAVPAADARAAAEGALPPDAHDAPFSAPAESAASAATETIATVDRPADANDHVSRQPDESVDTTGSVDPSLAAPTTEQSADSKPQVADVGPELSNSGSKVLDPAPEMVAVPPRTPAATNAVEASAAATPEIGRPRVPTVTSVAATPNGRPYAVPEMYRDRMTPNRQRIAESYGGSAQTEAAVVAALDWLVRHQDVDGRWDASDHGAGQETRTLGQDRKGAGAQADTGLTGLALLAFLGSGHTHLTGPHTSTVKRGIDYLLATQAANGNLAGDAELFAFMYCHGMATLALTEAYAMTGDPRLARPVSRAIAYTNITQIPTDGGWRYKYPYAPGERGDTSHLGWQLMALKSGELSGLTMPERTRQGLVRFLNSVSSGTRGGLASYKREERVTHSMTAEALACREFLGIASAGASDEAADFLLSALPGHGAANFYYWYYGTLAMFQHQGSQWTAWNNALSGTLMHSQRPDGDAAGSWDPDRLWGGYGGRVFSTSLGTLCLEVYYRYLPLYSATAKRDKPAR